MQHLAIIPDGNRRWAKQNKLQTLLGHQKGGHAVKDAISVCLKNSKTGNLLCYCPKKLLFGWLINDKPKSHKSK